MSTTRNPFLLMPWGLFSIIGILVIWLLEPKWLDQNSQWLIIALIFPAAVLENIKTGFSSMRIMFLKLFYTLLSFLMVGIGIGIGGLNFFYREVEGYSVPFINIPLPVVLAVGLILLIELANVFSLLKAVKRELGSFG